jgi:hypothetical protein
MSIVSTTKLSYSSDWECKKKVPAMDGLWQIKSKIGVKFPVVEGGHPWTAGTLIDGVGTKDPVFDQHAVWQDARAPQRLRT